MAFTAIRRDEIREYVSPHDPDPEKPTVWLLGALDHRARTYIDDMTTEFEVSSSSPKDKAKVSLRINERNFQLVRFGLKGWRGFLGEDGQEIPFDTDTVSIDGRSYKLVAQRLMEFLPYQVIAELAGQVDGQNRLSEAEKRNLG